MADENPGEQIQPLADDNNENTQSAMVRRATYSRIDDAYNRLKRARQRIEREIGADHPDVAVYTSALLAELRHDRFMDSMRTSRLLGFAKDSIRSRFPGARLPD